MKNRTIKVDYLARVEGEGSLVLKIAGDRVADAKLSIFEPPRFFEAFLRGRSYEEAPDITARICGICPIAYQMSSSQAMEAICGAKVDGQLRALRRLIYCGEWIESHALHIYLLHAPDFLGYEDAIRLAKDHPKPVERGLELKKIGNEIMTIVGGREIHPVNLRVGGFYHAPDRSALQALVPKLKWARDAAVETAKLVSTFSFPDFERDYTFVALRHPDEYAITDGRLVSNRGLDVAVDEYDTFFSEEHVAHSNALHSVMKGHGAYHVGPLARYSLNFEKLSPLAQQAARSAGLGATCRNPFKSVVVRAVELIHACDEALRLVEQYEKPEKAVVALTPRAGVGYGATEAPRGVLVHRYRLDERGIIQDAKIVPPTAQNLRTIEADLREFAGQHLDLPDDKLTWQCEQAVRNYDPCISCATHFLRVRVDRE